MPLSRTREPVVVDPKRGHAYLTAGTSLCRRTPPSAENGGALQALRCIDSGGRYVDDLSRAIRPGTVYGVDWVERPFAAGEVTRAYGLTGLGWADDGVYVVREGAVWFYAPGRRTLTLKTLGED
ncbi:hypothetical protein BGM09_06045 [Streptomyces sp. CBMA29]|nr:hypothetical protein [Streptomyces sp. CBMA29]